MQRLEIKQAFDFALMHHRAGRFLEAEQLYQEILAEQADHPDATHLQGVIALQTGRKELAVALLRRAIALNPNWPEAHNNLGVALNEIGRPDESISVHRQAIALNPNSAEGYCNLGNALKSKRQFGDAIDAYRRAIALSPNYFEAHYNLGIALKDDGQADASIATCIQAIALRPDFADGHSNLGIALSENGRVDEAIAAFRQAVALMPNHADAYGNLGNALKDKGMLDEAIAAYRQAIALKPESAMAHNNLGNVLRNKGEFDESIVECGRAISLQPDFAEALSNLGNALRDKGQPDKAIAAYREAIAFKPDYADAFNNLGNALGDLCQIEEAIAAFRRAIELYPDHMRAHDNLLFTLFYDSAYDARAIAAESRRWNERHAEPLRKFIRPHANDANPDRRLRVGYVSADFWSHASAFFLVPLLENRDSQNVEQICYAQVLRPDDMTRRLQSDFDGWRNIVGLSDEQVAQQIREDRIDILVDLKLHTAGNRLLVFARKPAPVQVTWLGYPGSTGLSTMDYRLSDPFLDPPGMDESVYSERTIRLPDTFWCYDPLDGREIPVNSLPARKNGFVTFGCLNLSRKINEEVLALWGRILKRVDDSRLLLRSNQGTHRQWAANYFSQQGIDPSRIEFTSYQPRANYLELYHRIDIGLDSFPCNGHTTTLDSLWMGVPVISLVGQTPMGRAGWCQLSNLGLTELAGETGEQVVEAAAKLATDLPRLEALRSTLRGRIEKSPLMDGPRFARNIEAAYRQMWGTWCSTVSRAD